MTDSPLQPPIWRVALLIWVAFVGVYTVTYLGFPLYADELIQFDTVQNWVRRGELVRTYGHDLQTTIVTDGAPWMPAAQEPLMTLVLSPLTALGIALPDAGIVHVTALGNIFISALTIASFYAVARRLGWAHRPVLIAAVLLGLSTFTWTYSRLLFREPLMAVFMIWAVGLALELHENPRSRWRWAAFLTALIGMMLTKVVTILALPGLLLLLLPDFAVFRRNRRWVGIGLVALLLVVVAGAIASTAPALDGTRYSWSRWEVYVNNTEWTSVLESLLGYQFSPARSIWLYAPVLLLGLFGMVSLIRTGQWRIVAAPVLMIIGFSVGYGVIHGTVWWGGWSWGPRYFVPLLPVLMLWTLPVIERVRWPLIAAIGLLGMGIQLLGMAVPPTNYYSDQVALGNTNLFGRGWNWMPATWHVEHSPPVYHLQNLDVDRLHIAWTFAADLVWLPPLLALVGAGMALIVLAGRFRWQMPVALGAFAVILAAQGVGIHTLRDDPRYVDLWPEGAELAAALNTNSRSDQAVIIERGETGRLFMNALATPELVVTLQPAPGALLADLPDADIFQQAGMVNAVTVRWLLENYDDVWLVTGNSPFEADKRRPLERILAQYAFPVTEISTGDRARALHYAAPHATPQETPALPVNITLADALTLEGFDLPAGDRYASGDVLPLSLSWVAADVIPFDYHLNIYLAGADGVPLVQQTGGPQATFGAMTAWAVGERQRDPHALVIPADAAPGDYTLRLVVYDWRDGSRLTTAAGADSIDLTTITVTD